MNALDQAEGGTHPESPGFPKWDDPETEKISGKAKLFRAYFHRNDWSSPTA